MSTPVRQSISTALAILSVSPVVAVDLSPTNSVAVARPAMRRPVQTQTGFARIRLLRSKTGLQLPLIYQEKSNVLAKIFLTLLGLARFLPPRRLV